MPNRWLCARHALPWPQCVRHSFVHVCLCCGNANDLFVCVRFPFRFRPGPKHFLKEVLINIPRYFHRRERVVIIIVNGSRRKEEALKELAKYNKQLLQYAIPKLARELEKKQISQTSALL